MPRWLEEEQRDPKSGVVFCWKQYKKEGVQSLQHRQIELHGQQDYCASEPRSHQPLQHAFKQPLEMKSPLNVCMCTFHASAFKTSTFTSSYASFKSFFGPYAQNVHPLTSIDHALMTLIWY